MILGQRVDYPRQYNPDILQLIARQEGRANLPVAFLGVDVWHAYELSWLNAQGIPQCAMVRIIVPATSLYIVESKSLKLYLNSFNFTRFADTDTVAKVICQDLSARLHCETRVEILSLDDVNSLPIAKIQGMCIDNALDGQEYIEKNSIDPLLLAQMRDEVCAQSYYSHLLRSNCPVTNQPDWATVSIEIVSAKLDTQGLLAYLLSYRNHNGFHESCIEQIFFDLSRAFVPKSLKVQAWFTRRGGIDINPCRVSDLSLLGEPSRLRRQ